VSTGTRERWLLIPAPLSFTSSLRIVLRRRRGLNSRPRYLEGGCATRNLEGAGIGAVVSAFGASAIDHDAWHEDWLRCGYILGGPGSKRQSVLNAGTQPSVEFHILGLGLGGRESLGGVWGDEHVSIVEQ
jgi:hypothetical protein